MHQPPSDHLLRVLGREATSNRVLDLGCGDGRHTEPLARLGFDLYACDENVETARERLIEVWGEEEAKRRITPAKPTALGYPDAFFDWVVAYGAYDELADAADLMDALTRLFDHAEFAPAGVTEEAIENGERVLRGIFRKVDGDVSLETGEVV